MKPNIEQILCSFYIRYENLYKMIYDNFAGSTADTINIYVDLYSMIKPIYTQECIIDDYRVLVSCIINLCAHYREFFSRYPLCVKTNIYLVYSDNIHDINNKFYKGYNKLMVDTINNNPRIDELIRTNFKLLDILSPYLPNIYFINGTFETGVIIYDLILSNSLSNPQVPSLILSKDQYLYQLPALHDNIILFRPKKNMNGDCSYYINKSNVLPIYLKENKIKYQITENYPETFSLLLALSHCKSRGITMELNISAAYKLILNLINNHIILGTYTSLDTNISKQIEYAIFSIYRKNVSNIEQRFKAIDIPYQNYIYSQSIEKNDAMFKIVDISNKAAVQEINNKYFIKHPLDLNRL